MDLLLYLWEGKHDGLFNFRESKKRLNKTPKGSFFVNLVPLGWKRDNLSREYSSNQLRIRVLLLHNSFVWAEEGIDLYQTNVNSNTLTSVKRNKITRQSFQFLGVWKWVKENSISVLFCELVHRIWKRITHVRQTTSHGLVSMTTTNLAQWSF